MTTTATTTIATDYAPPRLGYGPLFLKFLRFGCLAFGGPVAQIAMVRAALVDEERWIAPERFNRLLAVMQILPGPEAHELCVHLGMLARGRIGGLLAGLGFMLPGLILMLLAGWAYRDWLAGNPHLLPVFFGIQLAVLAIILRAVQRIGTHIVTDRLLWALALGAFAATLAGVPFWMPLVASGFIYAVGAHQRAAAATLVIAATLGMLFAKHGAAMPFVLPSLSLTDGAGVAALFIAGLKGGMLTFGGAYTAIPYVRADTVGRGWLSDAAFLDGVALAGILPAPLVIFATFAGYVVGGLSGALAMTAGMFLPAFAFSLIFFERLEAVVDQPALHHVLSGVAAAVVGVIAATWLQLGRATAMRATDVPEALLIFALSVAAVWVMQGKWVAPALIVAAGAAGWIGGQI